VGEVKASCNENSYGRRAWNIQLSKKALYPQYLRNSKCQASMLDLETTGVLLAHQDMKLSSMETEAPEL
jgi:hypothetical protein